MISTILMAAMITPVLMGMATVEGTVMGDGGKPIAGARVFLEPGLAGAVLEAPVSAEGKFKFDDVPPEGVGVFALGPEFGFGGKHVIVAVAEEKVEVNLTLHPAATLKGRIIDNRGHAVEGARITRVGILNANKVGIPLGKLAALGIELPASNAKGDFSIANMPRGEKVALKINHPDYAQEAVESIPVDGAGLKITLEPGVLVSGQVLSRESRRAIGGISVLMRNALPPNDTAVAETDAQGMFLLRLKPGNYVYQAAGAGLRSPGWEKLEVSGDQTTMTINLPVAATATLRGEVHDAVSGAPIPGVKILVETNGAKAAMLRTGPTGEFFTVVAEGENVVRLENAAGYLPPAQSVTRFSVAAGEAKVLPGIWLAPLPVYRLQVLSEDGQQPVSGAVVTLVQPRQMGWHVTGPDGWADLRISHLPKDGQVIGMAEDVRQLLGAWFILGPESVKGAKVQLLRLAGITGKAVNEKGKALEGAVVGGEFAGGVYEDDLVLWQGLSGKDGNFAWNAIVPGTPQRCIAKAGKDGLGVSITYNPKPETTEPLGNVVVANAEPGLSWLGKEFPFKKFPAQHGAATKEAGPAVVVFAGQEEAAAVMESVQNARTLLEPTPLKWAVAVDGVYSGGESSVPVLSGKSPGRATTFVLDRAGKVVLETFGLPPLRVLQEVCK